MNYEGLEGAIAEKESTAIAYQRSQDELRSCEDAIKAKTRQGDASDEGVGLLVFEKTRAELLAAKVENSKAQDSSATGRLRQVVQEIAAAAQEEHLRIRSECAARAESFLLGFPVLPQFLPNLVKEVLAVSTDVLAAARTADRFRGLAQVETNEAVLAAAREIYSRRTTAAETPHNRQ